MTEDMKKKLIWVALGVGAALAAYFMLLGIGFAHAQSRGPTTSYGDVQSILNGFRAFLGIASLIVPGVVLAYYTWKYRPKDAYEAAWLALGWCGLAYVLR